MLFQVLSLRIFENFKGPNSKKFSRPEAKLSGQAFKKLPHNNNDTKEVFLF